MNESRVEKIKCVENPDVSIVIPHFYPSREQNLKDLIEELKKQTYKNIEIIISHRTSPQGKAINEGARQAVGDVLIVMDDDSQMDQSNLLEKLISAVRENPKIAMAGASIVSPDNINSFQRAAAKQFPRFHMPVVKEITDSDLACHGCVAFNKKVFEQVGMERENILRGLDPDLRVRIREAGYRVVLVPDTWVYHPFPATVRKFMRLFFRNGYGSAYTQIHNPEISYDTDESLDSTNFVAKRSLLYRIVRYPFRLLNSLIKLQWIRLLGYSVYIVGYVVGFAKFSFSGKA